jgi:hypothetical protein
MRLLALAATLCVLPTLAAQVDLDRPGVLGRLKVERPKHYEAVTEVLRASERMPCKDGEMRVLKAKYDLRELSCNALLLASYPPQRRVNFEVEGTAYVAVVTVKGTEGRAMPAKGEAR